MPTLLLVAGLLLAAEPPARAEPASPLPERPVALRGQAKFQHSYAVQCLAFSPDGKLLATGGTGSGRCLCIWEFSTGKLLRQFDERGAHTGSLAFSPDGKQIATAVGWSARVWEVATEKLVHDLEGHTNGVEKVAWSDDGRWIATASRDSTVRLWDAKAGKLAHVLKVEKWRPEQVVFSPGSKLLATVGRDSILRVWDPATGKELRRFEAKGVGFSAFSPDGSQMVWGGEGVLHAWATEGKEPPRVLSKGDGFFSSPVFSPDGRTIATGIPDGSIRLLDAKTGRETRRWKVGNYWLGALVYSPDGKTIVNGGQWTSVPQRWRPATGKEIEPAAGHTAWAQRLCFPPGDKTLLSLGGDNKLIRWDLATRALKAVTLPDRRMGHIHAFSPDGKLLAVGGLDSRHKVIQLVDVATGRLIREIDGHKTFARTVAFAHNGKWLATIDADATIRIWDLPEGKPRLRIDERAGERRYGRAGTFPMLFSHDDRWLVNAGIDGVLRLYDTATGKLLHKYDMQCEAGGVAVFPDDKLVAVLGVANDKPTVLLWDPTTGKVVRAWETGQQAIHGVSISPDGRLLATASIGNEYSVKLWDVATKQEVAQFKGEQGATIPLAFSRDGRTLATGCTDSTVLLWDVTGRGAVVGKVLPTKRLQELWHTLADLEAKKTHAAVWEMAISSDGAVPFLRDRVAPVKSVEVAVVDRLVKQLGGDEFAARQSATKELEKLGGAAVAHLQKVLEGKPDLEVRRRVEAVVTAYHRGDDWQRQRQALAVLERGGSDAAWKLIEWLATGADGAPLTEEARSILARRKQP